MAKTKKVKLNKTNRDALKNLNTDFSIDTNLNTLMDVVENIMPFVKYSDEVTSINLHQKTIDKLDSFKICNGESRDAIITRLLLMFDEIDNTSSEGELLWISFKLSSPLNKKLTISAIMEYSSKDIMFNEGNEVYGWDLPSTYTVNGENMTVEFKSWIDLLDWVEIKELVRNHFDKSVRFNKTNYYLEVNP